MPTHCLQIQWHYITSVVDESGWRKRNWIECWRHKIKWALLLASHRIEYVTFTECEIVQSLRINKRPECHHVWLGPPVRAFFPWNIQASLKTGLISYLRRGGAKHLAFHFQNWYKINLKPKRRDVHIAFWGWISGAVNEADGRWLVDVSPCPLNHSSSSKNPEVMRMLVNFHNSLNYVINTRDP